MCPRDSAAQQGFTMVEQQGFTMVEMLVSLLLLSIVMAGTLALQLASSRSSSDARFSSSAIVLAQSRLEQFRGADYASLTTTVTPEIACFDGYSQWLASCNGAAYTRTLQVVPTLEGLRADVTVQWMTRGGARQLAVSMERNP